MSTGARQREADESGHGVQIARIGGVPVYLAPSWFVIALVIVVIVGPPLARARPDLGILAYGFGVLQALLLLACVLVHEGAHAVVARALGLPVVRVVANLWGGHTSMEAGRSRPGSLALVAAAGPAANAAFAAVAWLALQLAAPGDVAARLLEGLVIINGSLAVLNILPGMPLDGGQIVESGVWKVTGDRNRGSVVAGWCGRVLTVLVVLWFFGRPLLRGQPIGFGQLWILLIATVLWGGASQSIQRGRALAAIGRIRLTDVMRPVVAVPATASVAAAEVGGREVVLIDAQGHPTAYVDAQHLAAVPAQARTQTPLSAVASQQHPGWVVDADPAGDVLPVLAALQELGIAVCAVVHHGRLVGLVHARDIGAALSRN